MLYDNALLARLYLHGWQVTGEDRFRQVLTETVGYVRRDLGMPGGGFASAEDADSEGEEGRFYVWTPEQVRAALDRAGLGEHAEDALAWWGIEPGRQLRGCEHPQPLHARGRLARPEGIEAARRALLEDRSTRVRPGLDDKVLTEWNALMISALAEAGAALGEQAWVDAATGAADFLLAELRRADGRWLRAWHPEGGARHLAYAADHGALLDAFLRLAEATGRSGGWPRPAPRPTRCSSCSGTTSGAACSPPAAMPRS
jgi:uncharacterized protein